MQKIFVFLLCATMMLASCGKDEATDQAQNQNTDTAVETVSEDAAIAANIDKWSQIAGNSELFSNEFNKFTPAQQYYFCSAFTMGAMSASKPATASAMVSYFLGLGVIKYSQGIDDKNYYAFDMGKNIFLYELVVNYILEEKICENVMLQATDYAKESKISTDEINEKGKPEALKIVDYINKNKI